MTISAAIHHITHYKYDRPVILEPQTIRLRPAPHCRTKIPAYSLKVTPAEHFVNWQQDPHGNWQARFVFPEKVTEFKVEVDLTAELAVVNPFDFFIEPYAEQFPFAYEPELMAQLAPYLDAEPLGPRLAAYLAGLPKGPIRLVNFLVDLNTALRKAIRYLIRMEPGVQTPEETLELSSGSCRNSAWALVQILRHLGLAARFVSGYLIQLRADIEPVDGPKGTNKDFTDLHAWAEVYLPGAGWIGMDPTSGMLCGEGHLPVAATPHYRSAAPISGLVEPANVDFHFDMRVTRVGEAPRITLPFSESAWAKLDALGEKVDADLVRHDVRLTMGGEPTFVSIDDFESEEWNTAAVGPTKRTFADKFIRRLQARFAPGGMLHHGQGKWYPGKSLPRWSFALYWRKDGKPVWNNPAFFADVARTTPAGPETSSGVSVALVEKQTAKAGILASGIAERLGIETGCILPAYEDPAAWLVKEANLPENTDPLDPKIEDPEERGRMIRTFARGLDETRGLCPAGAALQRASGPGERRGAAAMAKRKMGIAARQPFSRPWQFPSRLPVALAVAAMGPGIVLSVYPRAGPVGRTRRPAGSRRDRPALPRGGHVGRAAGTHRTGGDRRRGAHGAVGRAARRRPLRLHAAGQGAGRLPRTSRGGRSERRGGRPAGAYRRLSATHRSARQRHQGHARSWRHRSQHSSSRKLARARRHNQWSLRGRPSGTARRR